MIQHNDPSSNYDEKFASFIEMIEQAKKENAQMVVIANPQVLGDSYEELIESLSRLAEAGLGLQIAGR